MSTTVTKTNPLGTERIGRLILTFAVPSIISMVVNALYNIVDQIFIGQGSRVPWKRRYQCRHANDGDCDCIKPADR